MLTFKTTDLRKITFISAESMLSMKMKTFPHKASKLSSESANYREYLRKKNKFDVYLTIKIVRIETQVDN